MTLCCHSCVTLARSHPSLSLCFFWEVGIPCHSLEARPCTSDIHGVTLLSLVALCLVGTPPPPTTPITVTKPVPGASRAVNPEVILGSRLL